jgi:uncharacterized protein YjcR
LPDFFVHALISADRQVRDLEQALRETLIALSQADQSRKALEREVEDWKSISEKKEQFIQVPLSSLL